MSTRPATGRGRRVTIVDVAALSGVSRQTVTRAMNDMDGISAATKARVLTAARQLGYQPSRFGRGLVRHDHHTLGLVIDNLMNPYYPELASAVVTRAAERGWTVLLLDCSGVDDQREMLSQVSDQVDAVIGYVVLESQELDLTLPGIPVVRIDPSDARSAVNQVQFDLRPGMEELADHLLARGVRRPVMVDSSRPGEATERARSFIQAMKRRGLDVPVVHSDGDQLDSGLRATEEIIVNLPDTDMIMCFNDITAFGALKALRQQHLTVPDQIRVVGIDGLVAGTYVTPQLTSLALDMTDVAAVSVDIALGRLDGSIAAGSRAARRKVRHRLLVREST
jgi:DNA-binding LacI/PurR family transcriptional regulator